MVSIALYFILEFNLSPSNVKAKLNDLNENTVGRVKAMMPNSSENFEADEEILQDFLVWKSPDACKLFPSLLVHEAF